MKAMPLPFEELQRKGVLDFAAGPNLDYPPEKLGSRSINCYVGSEPTSVLDNRRSPSPPTSTSTLSSPVAGGGRGSTGSTDTTPPAAALVPENPPTFEKYGVAVEDWESVLSEPSSQEQSILRLIMGEIEDPSFELNKLLQNVNGSQLALEFTAGAIDQSFIFEPTGGAVGNIGAGGLVGNIDSSLQGPISSQFFLHNPNFLANDNGSFGLISDPNLLCQSGFQYQPQITGKAAVEEHPAMFMLPPAKRLNFAATGPNFQPSPVQLFPHYLHLHRQKTAGADGGSNHRGIVDQLFQAAELIGIGNPVLAQAILARLNHQLSPVGKPFQRAAFYFKEALLLLLNPTTLNSSNLSPLSLVFKIGAYKSYSDVSPVLHFANFTANQAILEAVDGFDRIHLVDFDIGHGGQWASFMQELALKNGGSPFLKITAFSSIFNELELGFTRENLQIFANGLNVALEIEVLSLESLNSGSFPVSLHLSEITALAVNLPASPFAGHPLPVPMILHFIKHLSPKIIVSLNHGFDQSEVSFSHQIINSHEYFSGLLESLDAMNINLDLQQKIERFLLQPSMEKIVLGGHHLSDRQPFSLKSLFLSSGFSPWSFSNFTESQADCLLRRAPARGFHVEKRQASLVLFWQQKELISASAWRC